jgi:hypothetical protein
MLTDQVDQHEVELVFALETLVGLGLIEQSQIGFKILQLVAVRYRPAELDSPRKLVVARILYDRLVLHVLE